MHDIKLGIFDFLTNILKNNSTEFRNTFISHNGFNPKTESYLSQIYRISL